MLLFDLGNSRLKWTVVKDGSFSTMQSQSILDQTLVSILDSCWSAISSPKQLFGVSVASESLSREIEGWCQRQWGSVPEWFQSEPESLGLRCGYEDYRQLGSDRWAALLGARSRYPGEPIVVVDCGSAMTVDLLTAQGEHLGGAILPGYRLMAETLQQRTAKVRFSHSAGNQFPARTTDSGVGAGLALSAAGAVRQAVAVAEAMVGKRPCLLLTGGDGPRLQTDLGGEGDLLPDLVLQGLYRYYAVRSGIEAL